MTARVVTGIGIGILIFLALFVPAYESYRWKKALHQRLKEAFAKAAKGQETE